jgi:hypothetical protein
MTYQFEPGSSEPIAIIPPGHTPETVEMTGLAEKVGNAVGAKELMIAMQAAEAWAVNRGNAAHLSHAQVTSVAQKAMHAAHMACKCSEAPEVAATSVHRAIEQAIDAAQREAA